MTSTFLCYLICVVWICSFFETREVNAIESQVRVPKNVWKTVSRIFHPSQTGKSAADTEENLMRQFLFYPQAHPGNQPSSLVRQPDSSSMRKKPQWKLEEAISESMLSPEETRNIIPKSPNIRNVRDSNSLQSSFKELSSRNSRDQRSTNNLDSLEKVLSRILLNRPDTVTPAMQAFVPIPNFKNSLRTEEVGNYGSPIKEGSNIALIPLDELTKRNTKNTSNLLAPKNYQLSIGGMNMPLMTDNDINPSRDPFPRPQFQGVYDNYSWETPNSMVLGENGLRDLKVQLSDDDSPPSRNNKIDHTEEKRPNVLGSIDLDPASADKRTCNLVVTFKNQSESANEPDLSELKEDLCALRKKQGAGPQRMASLYTEDSNAPPPRDGSKPLNINFSICNLVREKSSRTRKYTITNSSAIDDNGNFNMHVQISEDTSCAGKTATTCATTTTSSTTTTTASSTTTCLTVTSCQSEKTSGTGWEEKILESYAHNPKSNPDKQLREWLDDLIVKYISGNSNNSKALDISMVEALNLDKKKDPPPKTNPISQMRPELFAKEAGKELNEREKTRESMMNKIQTAGEIKSNYPTLYKYLIGESIRRNDDLLTHTTPESLTSNGQPLRGQITVGTRKQHSAAAPSRLSLAATLKTALQPEPYESRGDPQMNNSDATLLHYLQEILDKLAINSKDKMLTEQPQFSNSNGQEIPMIVESPNQNINDALLSGAWRFVDDDTIRNGKVPDQETLVACPVRYTRESDSTKKPLTNPHNEFS